MNDATIIMKEKDTKKRKLIESVLFQPTNNLDINRININTDKFNYVILINLRFRFKKNFRKTQRKWNTGVTT